MQKSTKAIKGAIDLFINENANVEVSNLTSTDKKKYKIREYLNRIKLNKFDKVEITNVNIQYIGKPRKGSNGQYYSTVLFEQVFNGLQDGHIIYEERVLKKQNITVKVKEVNKNLVWDVFLNDIGVEETKI